MSQLECNLIQFLSSFVDPRNQIGVGILEVVRYIQTVVSFSDTFWSATSDRHASGNWY
jgi:hypothetical protein